MNNRLLPGLAAALLAAPADPAGAIPAFARKYDMSCTTCHAPAPKLKAYGEEFAGNAFRLADRESPRAYRSTGDAELMLLRDFPLAVRLDGAVRWQPQASGRTDIQAPYLMKLLSGAEIWHDVGYYFYFYFNERGDVAGVEDAYIVFNDLFHSGLDAAVGQFQVSDPLFKRELRLTLEDYEIYRTAPGDSRINLAYDRGVFLSYALPTGTDIVLEILNGNGIPKADDARNFDRDLYKNLMLRISQDAGAALRIGGFGYWGKEAGGAVNTVWMAGPDLTISLEPLEINAQYVERRDNNPLFLAQRSWRTTRGGMAEIIYTPGGDRSSWYAAGLYNRVTTQGEQAFHTLTAHGGYLLARNIRLYGEYTYDLEVRASALSAGFASAF
ncbi:MAG: hypothetical protein WB626_10320 [Bacteroidota bacterium]